MIRGKKSYQPVYRTIGMNKDLAGKADLNICGVNTGRKAQSSKIYCMEMGTEIAKIGKQPHSTKHQIRVCSFCNLSATVNTMKGKENIEYRKQEPSLLCAGRFEYYPHTG